MTIYAIYKGDKFLCTGTAKECAIFLEVKIKTIYFYTTKAYKKRFKSNEYADRIIVIKIGKEKEEIL